MIGSLKGRVETVGPDTVLIDVNGVGYEVHCPVRVLSLLSLEKDMVSLTIETVVREDMIRLYGFLSTLERDWFRLLQGVQGVGARVALSILSVLSTEDLTQALARQDHAMVARAQGVGPKLAKRIVSELKDKAPAGAIKIGVPAVPASDGTVKPAASPVHDAVSALTNLGYGENDALRAVDLAAADLGEGADVEALIRTGLRNLM